jgi:signal peptidase I
MSTILILLALLLVSLFVQAAFLWLGTKWTKIPRISYLRCMAATVALFLLSMVLWPIFAWVSEKLPRTPVLTGLAESGLALLLAWLVLMRMLRTSLLRAIGAWLTLLLGTVTTLALAIFVIKTYAVDAYIMPTNSMAPTLLGPHREGICPHCGKRATVAYYPDKELDLPGDQLGICRFCQQAGNVTQIDPTILPSDRFLVNRLLTPRRWDVVVFRFIKNPTVRYAQRLVGFPGEEVVIKEGRVWIKGVKQEPPPQIAHLTFTPAPEGRAEGLATPERPMRLASNEYCVLGDFSLHCSDSRTWGPLPGGNIEAVVTMIYWPPSRLRLFR